MTFPPRNCNPGATSGFLAWKRNKLEISECLHFLLHLLTIVRYVLTPIGKILTVFVRRHGVSREDRRSSRDTTIISASTPLTNALVARDSEEVLAARVAPALAPSTVSTLKWKRRFAFIRLHPGVQHDSGIYLMVGSELGEI